jgi:hypothetical protein
MAVAGVLTGALRRYRENLGFVLDDAAPRAGMRQVKDHRIETPPDPGKSGDSSITGNLGCGS